MAVWKATPSCGDRKRKELGTGVGLKCGVLGSES